MGVIRELGIRICHAVHARPDEARVYTFCGLDDTVLEVALSKTADGMAQRIAKLESERDALRVEVEKLRTDSARTREALQSLSDSCGGCAVSECSSMLPCAPCQARAVLAEKEAT